MQQFGVVAVRGCEIEGILDENGRVTEDRPDEQPKFRDDDRTFRVWLDCNQYQADISASTSVNGVDVYETFNVFMRRNPKENNFKAVLETIRDLMNTNCVVPQWLNDVFLGFGTCLLASQRTTRLTAMDAHQCCVPTQIWAHACNEGLKGRSTYAKKNRELR